MKTIITATENSPRARFIRACDMLKHDLDSGLIDLESYNARLQEKARNYNSKNG